MSSGTDGRPPHYTTLGSAMSAAMAGLISLDPRVFAIAGATLAVVSFAAAYAPARRSVRDDLSTILRAQ